jgi:type I restriction enzyme S subunit
MTNDWPRKKISEIAEHSLGKMLDKEKNRGELKPYLRNLNVRWFSFDTSDLLQMRFLPEEHTRYTVSKGDLVVCEGGYPGRAAIWEKDEQIYFQKALHRIRFHEPLHAKWCLYYLQSEDLAGTLKKHFNGAGILHFTGEAVARFELPLPPMSEQQRIVGILDKAFHAIADAKANAEENFHHSRALFDIHLQSVFTQRGEGWVQRRFEELIESNAIGLTKNSREQGGNLRYRYVKMNNITRDNRFDSSSFTRVNATTEEAARFRLRDGDFLFNTRNSVELVGKACIYENSSGEVVLFNNNIMRVRFKSSVDARFVLFSFSSQAVAKSLNELKSGTTNVAAIYYKDLRSLKVPLAPLDVQHSVASKLTLFSTQTQRLESLYRQKLSALEELKKSLLHQAFSGAL